jgi:hypothetical protein
VELLASERYPRCLKAGDPLFLLSRLRGQFLAVLYSGADFIVISGNFTMLPRCFKPSGSYDLVRIGRDHDGGYLVERGSVEKAKALISMGINNDWSFEKDFVKSNPVPLDAYDHTTRDLFRPLAFLKSLMGVCVLRYPFSRLVGDISLYMDYHTFFSGQNVHYSDKIGPASMNGLPLRETLARRKLDTPVYFKIDIEGSEYRILDELIECAAQVSGLTIEFHDIDLHKERMVSFIKRFPLSLVHIHPNNYGGKDENGDPYLLELTFADNPKPLTETFALPHALDQRNNVNAEDCSLTFE